MEDEEESSEDEFVKRTEETYDSDDSDDFAQQFSYAEDAAISADKVCFGAYRTKFKRSLVRINGPIVKEKVEL